MGIISYAQNFEDVLLWRALGHIRNGCYIDIGAHDPIVDSVSKAFYEHGWRGIHLEPLPVYCDALRRDRPDETVLQAAVAAETGVLRFFEIPDTGISTGDEAIAELHRERGFRINEITVPCVTLAEVFQLVKGDVVHWLKIDVEGLEEQVLQGWGESSLRPWVVVVESTLPLTQDEVYRAWEGLLLEKGYRCVHFDGLNRYYLAEEQPALESAFRSGPNVFDGFQFNGTASNTFTQHVAQNIRDELGGQIESLKHQALLHKADERRLAEALEHSEKLKQTLQSEQAANLQNQNAAKALALQFEQQARRETEVQLRTAMKREQEFTAQLQMAKDQLVQATQHFRQEIEAQQRRAMQCEQELTAQLLAAKDELRELDQVRSAREQQLQEQMLLAEHQSRQEIEAQLRTATQREQEFTAQLLAAKGQLQKLELARGVCELQFREQLRRVEQEAQQKNEAQMLALIQCEQGYFSRLRAIETELQEKLEKQTQLHLEKERELQREINLLLCEKSVLERDSAVQFYKLQQKTEQELRNAEEILANKEIIDNLQHVVFDLKKDLASIRGAWLWRIGAPFRLARHFFGNLLIK